MNSIKNPPPPQKKKKKKNNNTLLDNKKYRKAEFVQRRVCIVNVQSYLHENVVFSVCVRMGNAVRVHHIYHVEFHFRFRHLASFPVQLWCGCHGERS